MVAKLTNFDKARLAEQWFGFVHRLISEMQTAFRAARAADPAFNQKTIAARTGRAAAFISRCLSGQQNMTIRTIHDIARAMGYRLVVRLEPLASLPRANNAYSTLEQSTATSGSVSGQIDQMAA